MSWGSSERRSAQKSERSNLRNLLNPRFRRRDSIQLIERQIQVALNRSPRAQETQ